jgi:hypothetical protein
MAAKKGKTKSAKVSGMKSKKLSADQAGQVKGGLSISNQLGHKDISVGHKDISSWKLTGGYTSWKV